jgi:predicted phage baseplate assembly protein
MNDCTCGCCGGTVVQTPAPLANGPGLPAIGYRPGRYGQFLASMLARLSNPAYPALARLTVRALDDPAIALLDDWAIVGDLLSFSTERIANEGYLRTATEDGSLRLLGRLVGYAPRPGVAAGTYLAYTVDRDASGRDVEIIIPAGSRAQSVPAPGEDPQPYETADDLTARWSLNDLGVRVRRPIQLSQDDLDGRSDLVLSGTTTNLKPADRLLFDFSTTPAGTVEPGRQELLTVRDVRVDRAGGLTTVGLREPSSVIGLVAELTTLADDAQEDEMYDRSRIVRRFVDRVLGPLRERVLPLAGADAPTGPASGRSAGRAAIRPGGGAAGAVAAGGVAAGGVAAGGGPGGHSEQLARHLAGALAQLDEAAVAGQPYESVHRWFEGTRQRLLRLRSRAAALAASGDVHAPGVGLHAALGYDRAAPVGDIAGGAVAPDPALRALAVLLGALRRPAAHPPASARVLDRDPGKIFAPGSDFGPQLLAALDPRLRDGLYEAWRQVDVTASLALRGLQALRVVAAPFGATAPFQADLDAEGRVIGYSEWQLNAADELTVKAKYSAGRPDSATFTFIGPDGRPWRVDHDLTAGGGFSLGPWQVTVTVIAPSAPPGGPPSGSATHAAPHPPGVGIAYQRSGQSAPGLFLSYLEDGVIHLTLQNGTPLELEVPVGEPQTGSHGGWQVTAERTDADTAHGVSVSLLRATVFARNLLALDAVYDGISQGGWVVIDRPSKGQPDGIPGDPLLARVFTTILEVRTVALADFGITGKVTQLVLADDWLDGQDTSLAQVRGATVYTRGEHFDLATESDPSDVGGDQIELAALYEGLQPGRLIVVSGERADVPAAGIPGAEANMIAAVRQVVEPDRPGDAVHTVITLAVPLGYTYRRPSVHVSANVVRASHGATREEPIGSGDAGRPGQTFTLFQAPLTWLAADTPLGAASTLTVRVDGVRWQEIDSFAGRGPNERVYVTSTGDDGRTRVTFGDGIHGARLTTGVENVRARYRVGVGSVGNLKENQITQLTTRPLGVSGVNNPLPTSGGADPDDGRALRRGIPVAVGALDRLVGVADYEDFTRARAGMGRASASRLVDGSQEIVHVTVAGTGDIVLADDSDIVTALRASLVTFGDPRLPVMVAVREAVLLLAAATVQVDADHTFELVEPLVRAAVLDRLGFEARELGQPAYLSELFAAAQAVPGVDHVSVDVFAGVPGSLTPADLDGLLQRLGTPEPAVPARLATYDVASYTVADSAGETVASIAVTNGITVEHLLALNPGLPANQLVAPGTTLVVFRGVRPAQLVMFSAALPDTLILREANA